MKKTIITTILILILGVGLPATQVLSAPKSGDHKLPRKIPNRVGTKR
ncbi:MAG: hypothetical protein JRD05_11065 [Deltaproteobacteria bacterium]|nr:hypothetical protein [Deltaproteobacteria bacterium]